MIAKELKELLIKDLCARLPYGVKIVIQDTFKYSIVPREYHVLDVSNFLDIFCFNYKKFDKHMKKAMRERQNNIVIKHYLFPMSSMTEEQKKELQSLIIQDAFGASDNTFTIQDFYCKYHLDNRGLIEKDLAIDATDKYIY